MLTVALVQLRLVIPTHQRTLMLILRGYGKINTRFAIATCFQDPRSEPGLVWVLLRRALGRWFCEVCGRYMFPRSTLGTCRDSGGSLCAARRAACVEVKSARNANCADVISWPCHGQSRPASGQKSWHLTLRRLPGGSAN